MISSSKYQRTLQEILDSDDELTSDYIDTSFVPAYQDDSRFEYYEENNKTYKGLLKDTRSHPNLNTKVHKCTAIFNKKDAYSFQCIQKISSYDTSLWFFKFLLYKDVQSNYKFLKSCLILKYEDCYFKQAFKSKLSNSVVS